MNYYYYDLDDIAIYIAHVRNTSMRVLELVINEICKLAKFISLL